MRQTNRVIIITLTLFIIALGLAFALGWVMGQRRVPPTVAIDPMQRVHFTFEIPADTPPGDALYLAGTFNNWNPADPSYVLTRTADFATGSWVFTNGLKLEYKITRGSWQAVEKASDGREIANHQATVAPRLELTHKVGTWADTDYRDDAFYDERIERVDFFSQSLAMTRTFYVYVPPEVRSDPDLRVPSVYLVRGHEREWVNKNEDSSRNDQNVIDVYEELRATKAVEPMIMIFPGFTNKSGSVHSAGVNMLQPELVKDSSIGTGKFEDYFFNDLIPYVETHYQVLLGGAHRAIDGFSLGGFISVNLALLHPGEFASVGSYDGLFFWDDPETGTTIALTDTVFTRSLFDPNFGVPRDYDYAAKHNPLTLLRMDGAQAPRIQWLIEYGPEIAEPNVNYFRGARLDALLKEAGATNKLGGVVKYGSHSWRMADEHMKRALPLHWQRIK